MSWCTFWKSAFPPAVFQQIFNGTWVVSSCFSAPPASPRSVHHAQLELCVVSLKGHEGAAPDGSLKRPRFFMLPTWDVCFFVKLTDLFTHFPDILLLHLPTQRNNFELLKFQLWVAGSWAYRALLLMLLYHISSTVIQNRPTSVLPSHISVFFVSANLLH